MDLQEKYTISDLFKKVEDKTINELEGVEMIQNMVSRNPVVEQDVSWF